MSPAATIRAAPTRFDSDRLGQVATATWFGCFSLLILQAVIANPNALFGEPAIDVTAAAAWLAGANPWDSPWAGIRFAGPPTMLVPFVPFVIIGAEASRWVIGAICVVAAIAAVRRLRVPLWWLAWPPLFYAVIHGSIDALIPLMFLGGFGALAAYVKPYATVILSRREIGLLAVLMLVTAPILPWQAFLEQLPSIAASLTVQSRNLSVWGQPLMAAAVVLAAWRVGLDARWLIVPALWPLAQFQYGAMALPFVISHPLLAAGMAIPLPGAAAWTLIAWGLWRCLGPRPASVPT